MSKLTSTCVWVGPARDARAPRGAWPWLLPYHVVKFYTNRGPGAGRTQVLHELSYHQAYGRGLWTWPALKKRDTLGGGLTGAEEAGVCCICTDRFNKPVHAV